MYLASGIIVLHEENKSVMLTSKIASCSIVCNVVLYVIYVGQSGFIDAIFILTNMLTLY